MGRGDYFINLYTSAAILVETGGPSSYMPIAHPSSHVIRRAFNALKVTGEPVGVAGSKERPELRQMRA
jgi:hypothetical protein